MEVLEKAKVRKLNRINERIPKTKLTRVVIIGGGFAGIELVRQLSKANIQIVLVDKHNYHTFIPLLYQVATAGLSPGDISSPLREFLKENKNFHFRMAKVLEINAADKEIDTDLGKLSYDILVMASGSRTNFFGNEQIRKNANNLREISDAIELRTKLINNFEDALLAENDRELEPYMNVVIVGAGPTGVELAGAIGELRNQVLPEDYPELDFRRMNITLVEGGGQVLGAMSKSAGKKSEKYLKKFGVEVRLKTIVKSYDGEVAVLSDDTEIRTNCLIWAAGVEGNLVPGLHEEAKVNGRIKVNEFNLIEGHKYIYAIGDVALQDAPGFPKGLPMLAPVAIQHAQHLAKNILNLEKGKPLEPFKYVNKGTMATIGRNKAVVDMPMKFTIGGFFGWFIWMFIHLFSIIGFRRKILVFSNWVWNYFTYNQGNRLIIRKDIDD